MKRRFTLMVALAVTVWTAQLEAASATDLRGMKPDVDYVAGELLVRLADRARGDSATAESIIRRLGAEIAEFVPEHDLYLVRLGGDVGPALTRFSASPDVLQVAPNTIYPLLEVPTDVRFGEQWALQNRGQTGGVSDADIDANRAWDITTGDPGIIVGIVDSGVNYDHPDLDGGRYLGGWDFYSGDPDPMDLTGHGTHVAGIATADSNNHIGIAGVSQDSGYLALRVCTHAGCPTLRVLEGVTWAVDNGADVINLSLGGAAPNPFLLEAVRYAYQNGVVPVCAAGNHDDTIAFPAAYDECIAVAATDHADERASFSSTGQGLDVAAPGDDILSTEYLTYTLRSGTSMAAPHVVGLVALLLAQRPDLSIEEVRSQLRGTTDGEGFDHELGAGRINAEKALSTWFQPAPDADLGVATSLDCDPAGVPNLDASASRFCVEAGFETFAHYETEGPTGGVFTHWNGRKWRTSGNNAVCYVRDLVCKLPLTAAVSDCIPCGSDTFCATGSGSGGELPLTPYWRVEGGPWYRSGEPGEGSWPEEFASTAHEITVELMLRDAVGAESEPVSRECVPVVPGE